MIFTVSNSDELVAAFQSANDGDRIELTGGEYEEVRLKNREFDAEVEIVAADGSDPPIFRGALTITDVSGVNLSGIHFAPDGRALDILDLLLIRDSQHITVHSNTFSGHIPQSGEGLSAAEDIDSRDDARGLIEGQAFARGVRLDDSQNITLRSNEFVDLRKGIILDTVQDVEILGNYLHDLRSDGINLVDAVSVTIAENLMESFRPLHNYDNLAYADHGDFIQWWAGTGGLGIRDLVIRDNALLQGAGSWVQGIFGRSGSANADGTPSEFSGIQITNNLINTSHTNGIFVGDARDVEITGNTLLPAPADLTQPVITSGTPSIHIRTSATALGDGNYDFSEEGALPQDVRIDDNVVVGTQPFSSYEIDPALYDSMNLTAAGNTVLSSDPSDASYWGNLYPSLISAPVQSAGQLLETSSEGAGFDAANVPPLLSALLDNPLRQTDRIQDGTELDDSLIADGSGRIVDGAGGSDSLTGTMNGDVLRGGTGSDVITTGAGPDEVAFHRDDLLDGDVDTITDLDFDAGDALVFSGGFGAGFFSDDTDAGNSITTFKSGDSAIIHDMADLLELAEHEQIAAHSAGPGAVELRFDLDGDTLTDWVLRLNNISDIGEVQSSLAVEDLTLIGTAVAETLTGGSGHDTLVGSGGDDALTGGAGADEFRLPAVDLSNGTHVAITDLDFDDGDRIVWTDVSWLQLEQTGLQSGVFSIESTDGLLDFAESPYVSLVATRDERVFIHIDDPQANGINAVVELTGLSLPEATNVPELILGSSQAEVLRGQSGLSEEIFGGSGNDLLDGRLGSDTMFGGLGDDRYYVDIATDKTSELEGQGYDRVYTSVDYTLPDHVEAITARYTDNIRLTGNSVDNWLTGNSGDNALRGRDGADRLIARDGNDWLDGGIGADILEGGAGNDRYVVENQRDRVIEHAEQGYDLVYTSVDYQLQSNLEALSARGSDDIALFGNAGANWLTGNNGNNSIVGGDGADRLIGRDGDDVLTGGAGNDVLQGGIGDDVFSFAQGDGSDVVLDFEIGSDMLLIDVLSEHAVLEAKETGHGVLIWYGEANDTVLLKGMTQSTIQTDLVFSGSNSWVLDF